MYFEEGGTVNVAPLKSQIYLYISLIIASLKVNLSGFRKEKLWLPTNFHFQIR